MTGTSQSTDQPYGQIITDERALERLFRANYPKWVEDARKRLGPEGVTAAPRVVSKAFHLAWQDRKRFHSQEELDAFLGAQIHHGATREVSRKAGLHRMDNIGGASKAKHETHEMTVDEAWDRLKQTLQGGAPEAYRQRASTARHEAAAHVKGLAATRSWVPAIALGALAVAIGIGAMYAARAAGEDRAVVNALAAPDVRNHETSYGQQVNITLDDGTVARLGPESKLSVPNKFGIGLRAVRIDGTASFDVKTVGEQPFDVRAGKVAIIATGTIFVVRKYRDEENVIVHVKEGGVTVRFGDSTRAVSSGTSLMIDSSGGMTIPSTEQVGEAADWVDGKVNIAGRNLRYIIPQLKRWYGLDVKVPDAALLDRQVFLTAASNSPREALTSVEKSAGVKFSYIGENMVFQDTTPTRRGTKAR